MSKSRKTIEKIKDNRVTYLYLTNKNYANTDYHEFVDALKNNTSIEMLSVEIGNEGYMMLANVLKVNTTITEIDMRSKQSKISNKSYTTLVDTLKNNTSVTGISMDIGDYTISMSMYEVTDNCNNFCKLLTEVLETNKHITSIRIGDHISDEYCAKLVDILKDIQITYLSLYCCDINTLTCKALGELLSVSKTLQSLHVSRCDIDYSSFIYITEALKTNKFLITLGFNYCFGTDQTYMLYFSDALKVNNTLKELTLIDNCIQNSGAKVFAEALKVNRTLEILHQEDSFRDDIIVNALKFNPSIIALDSYTNDKYPYLKRNREYKQKLESGEIKNINDIILEEEIEVKVEVKVNVDKKIDKKADIKADVNWDVDWYVDCNNYDY
ncbi:MAG: hypothetical protein Homavirus20_9 [Homavirus sp.]|uniref:Leucine-rich repeat protein n=1 Tax=Homavirus sp. TaxID=2487769 RepID=A0A3G5A7Q7_9VIRU|nr:MAG: hypothetical protein Homavirus20_9 [Homavirus sp.]